MGDPSTCLRKRRLILCRNEWLSEAPKIYSIYEEAYVSIAATSAEGCSKGFLRPQAPNLPRSYDIPPDDAVIGNQPRQIYAC